MRFVRWFGLIRECYSIAGWRGIRACVLYLCGILVLDDSIEKSLDIYLGGPDA